MKIKKNECDARRIFTVFFLIIFSIGFSRERIFAQAGQGELIVEVKDANDATIDRAQLALTEIATARRIEAQTGQFTFNQILTNSNGANGAPTGLASFTGNAFAG